MSSAQEELKIVQLFLTRVAVSSFSLHENTVVLEVDFNDGHAKQIFRNTKLDEPAEIAEEILSDIVTMEENINMEFDGEQLVGAVNVVFHHYEAVMSALTRFVEDTHIKFRKVKDAKEAPGYLENVRRLQNAELKLYG